MHIETGRQIPSGSRTSARIGLVSRLLTQALRTVTPSGGHPTILDCGGGSGTYAVPLALAGADVTVVDISADALATLTRRADEAGIPETVHPVQGDVEALPELIGPRSFDLVLAHGILESVDDLPGSFAGIAAVVRPGGLISILVSNPVAAVLAHALAGNVELALHELRALDDASSRVGPHAVRALCEQAGLRLEAQHGIGTFSDLVPGSALDVPGARDALDELDAAASERAPFADVAARVHLLVRRPG